MLSHGERAKRVAEYCGTSLAMIESSYGKWIGGSEGFGQAALEASGFVGAALAAKKQAKPEPKPEPLDTSDLEPEQLQAVGMVRGGGFEPPRHFWH